MQTTDTDTKIKALIDCGPLKVWSVIVTVLGDLCQSRGDRISGRTLTRLLERMGISGQALRVAIHRLRRDGWIESEKTGRESAYRLTKFGWQQTQAARPRIYEPVPRRLGNVQMIIAPPALHALEFSETLPENAVLLTPRTALVLGPVGGVPEELATGHLDLTKVPFWIHDTLANEGLRNEYAALTSAVKKMSTTAPPDDVTDATVLRLLILHHWRRLRLRHNDLPDAILGPDWAGARARNVVFPALEALPRTDLTTLSESILTGG